MIGSKICDVYIWNIHIDNVDVLNRHITYFWPDHKTLSRKNTSKKVAQSPPKETKPHMVVGTLKSIQNSTYEIFPLELNSKFSRVSNFELCFRDQQLTGLFSQRRNLNEIWEGFLIWSPYISIAVFCSAFFFLLTVVVHFIPLVVWETKLGQAPCH